VYLEGRNITLISKAAVLCGRLRIHPLALGPLANNPFPDASPVFFETIARAMSLGIGRELAIVTPFSGLHKGRRDQAGARTGRTDGAVDVMHEAAGGRALWRLQQVP
jgi:7-cyano-7-deazaguanine synthase in queuosine biosynthesis